MSGVSFPVNRPPGRALIVGTASSRSQPLGVLQRLGFTCAETEDPYHAMLELARRPMVYRAMILSLTGLYKEELQVIAATKRRFPHVEVWLTHIEGRQASLAEAMRLGADGLLADDGLHRTAAGAFPVDTVAGGNLRADYAARGGGRRAARGGVRATPARARAGRRFVRRRERRRARADGRRASRAAPGTAGHAAVGGRMMSRVGHERILLVGDATREVQGALSEAMPGAHVTSVATYFDAIAEITAHPYTTVLASAEPIERRPEAAVKSLRQAAGEARVLLFGQPSLEPVSRKMLSFGCDDYLITPTNPGELHQVFGTPPLRIAPGGAPADDARSGPLVSSPPSNVALLMGLPLAELLLDAMLQHPHDTPSAAVKRINARIGPTMQLAYAPPAADPPAAPDGSVSLCHAVRVNNEDVASLCLTLPRDGERQGDESAGRHFLAQLAHLMGKIASLEDRHTRLQKLAITDELTGLYNGRYFRHFLTRIIDKARTMRFPVTLLLFDIDNFKKYNDRYGHGVGDEILRQTAALMRRCCRDHDLVARISGDEFAVVFWEKEGPRQPRDGKAAASPGRPPQSVMFILDRFRRLLSLPDFSNLGATGKGTLTISGGLAVFPYDAADVDGLIEAADRALMFGAKQTGKNSISLVGHDEPPAT